MKAGQSYWANIPDQQGPGDWVSFPIRNQIEPDESAQGYALRMSQLNAIPGLNELKKLIGKKSTSFLSETDAEFLSMSFGASVDSLRFALGFAAYGEAPGPATYAGHQLSKPTFVNRTFPRVCPACVQSDGRCKLSWDFSAVTACPEHRLLLVDICCGCGKKISWSRPGVGVCSCSMVLSRPGNEATELEVEFSRWLEWKVGSAHPDASVRAHAVEALTGACQSTGLMGMLWPLSLNAGLLISSALALAAKNSRLDNCGLPDISPLLHKARTALILADNLVRRIEDQDYGWFELSSRNPVVNMIAECMSGWATPADKSLAQSLLLKLGGMYKARQWSSPNPQLSQMLLF